MGHALQTIVVQGGVPGSTIIVEYPQASVDECKEFNFLVSYYTLFVVAWNETGRVFYEEKPIDYRMPATLEVQMPADGPVLLRGGVAGCGFDDLIFRFTADSYELTPEWAWKRFSDDPRGDDHVLAIDQPVLNVTIPAGSRTGTAVFRVDGNKINVCCVPLSGHIERPASVHRYGHFYASFPNQTSDPNDWYYHYHFKPTGDDAWQLAAVPEMPGNYEYRVVLDTPAVQDVTWKVELTTLSFLDSIKRYGFQYPLVDYDTRWDAGLA